MATRTPFKLDQLGSVGRGRSRHRPRNDPSLYGGDIPFFQTGDVKAAELYLHDYTQTYNDKGLAQSKLWQPGTICITIAANIAESAVLTIPGCFPDSVVGFIPYPDKSDGAFIKYYIDTLKLQMQSASRGTTQDNLSLDKLLTFDFLVPEVGEQRRIASILSAYDDLIENNTRRIAILEEMARRIYAEWFVRFRFPGHEQVKRVESELGLIPEGWKVQTVEQTFQILGGGTPSKAEPAYWEGGTINWYSPTDLTRAGTSFMEQSADRITALGLAKSSAKLFPPMSVMLTSRATIGVVAINTNEACTNQGFITCLPNSDYPLWLLYHWLKANVETFIGLGTGATFKEITKGTFKGIKLLVPPQNLVGAFSSTSEQLMLLSLNLQRKNRNLRATRDLLLPKLISGELDVSTLSEPTV